MRRFLCLTAFIAAATPNAATAQTFATPARRIIDSIAQSELAVWRAPGMVLAIVVADSVVYSTGYGTANVESGEPMSARMMVSVASVSKMVTATAAVVLAAGGKLDLNAPVRTYLPWLPERLGAVTISQLLSHRAGLGERTPNVAPEPNGSLNPVCRAMTDAVLIARPAETWSYSNSGYTLAGCVIEAVANAPFAQAVAQLVFQPVGMSQSTYYPRVAMTYLHAQGHDTRGGSARVVRPFNSSPSIAPAGELITTVGDLARLARVLLTDGTLDGRRVLPPGILAHLTQPHGLASPFLGGQREYGYGLFVRDHRGLRIVEHEGVFSGFGASIALSAEKRVAAVAVTNGRYSSPVRTTQAALELATGLSPSRIEASTKPIAARDSAASVGEYASASDTVAIVAASGRLSLRQRDRSFPIRARGEGFWEIPDFPAYLPLPATPLELVSDGTDGHPEFIRIAWRAYRRLP